MDKLVEISSKRSINGTGKVPGRGIRAAQVAGWRVEDMGEAAVVVVVLRRGVAVGL